MMLFVLKAILPIWKKVYFADMQQEVALLYNYASVLRIASLATNWGTVLPELVLTFLLFLGI